MKRSFGRPIALAAGLALTSIASTSLAADTFAPVMPAERDRAVTAEDGGAAVTVPKGDIGIPSIVVRSPPDADMDLVSPLDIEIAFESADGTAIDIASLHSYYDAFLRLGVTDRILEHAEIDQGVVRAAGAELPPGRHEFVVTIADALGRTAEHRFELRVRR